MKRHEAEAVGGHEALELEVADGRALTEARGRQGGRERRVAGREVQSGGAARAETARHERRERRARRRPLELQLLLQRGSGGGGGRRRAARTRAGPLTNAPERGELSRRQMLVPVLHYTVHTVLV